MGLGRRAGATLEFAQGICCSWCGKFLAVDLIENRSVSMISRYFYDGIDGCSRIDDWLIRRDSRHRARTDGLSWDSLAPPALVSIVHRPADTTNFR